MKVVELKYCSKRFGKLSENEIELISHGLLFKIFVITGWEMPATNEMQDVLVDQFRKKLVESYSDFNVEEIEYAFRNYSSGVEDWGKQMNLSLIDKVMKPYAEARLAASRIEESVKRELPAPQENLSDESMGEWMKSCKEITSIELMPVMVYDWAEKKGIVNYSIEQKKDFYKQAIARKFNQLLGEAQNYMKSEFEFNRDNEALANFTQMKMDNKFSDEEKKSLVSLAKKIALFEYFKTVV